MGERIIVSVVIMIIAMFLIVYMIEIFVPLAVNLDFRDMCRNYLMKMEFNSGLSNTDINNFTESLTKKGFSNIMIDAPSYCKFGTSMQLKVKVVYKINTIINIFIREKQNYIMNYNRTTIARRIIN